MSDGAELLHLPFPPSANTGTRHARGRHYLTAAVRAYREEVRIEVWRQRPSLRPLTGRLAVATLWAPPDRRRRDGHNLTKTLHDALTGCLWADDEQAYTDLAMRLPSVKPGHALLLVAPWEARVQLLSSAAQECARRWEQAAGEPTGKRRKGRNGA